MTVAHLLIGGHVAGGQLVALRFARALRERGDTSLFVSPEDGEFVARLRAEGFVVELVDVGRLHRIRGALRLARTLRRHDVDVLHTHTLAAANALGRLAARAAGARVISHLHIENHFRASTRQLLRTADNLTAHLAARLIAVSNDTRRAYEQQGYPHRVDVVYNGVDPPAPTHGDLRSELDVPRDAPLIAEVGRLCDVKGQRELIEALVHVPGAFAVLVGRDLEQDGRYEQELRAAAERAAVADRVVFAGERAAAEVLAAADVFALPSWTEGLPLVVLEAMAYGVPVVATPVGGTPELVEHERTGLLVPPRAPRALAEALVRLTRDEALRRTLADNARRRVTERFSAAEMERRMLEIYDDVAA